MRRKLGVILLAQTAENCLRFGTTFESQFGVSTYHSLPNLSVNDDVTSEVASGFSLHDPARGFGHAGTDNIGTGDGTYCILDSFVVDPVNQVAAKAVEDLLADKLQHHPLVLVGNTGTGKSAIALGVAKRCSDSVVLYGHDLHHLLGEAYETDSLNEFRNRYETAALVVIEDLHQLHHRTDVMDEVIRIIEFTQKNGIQLVITLPRPPAEVATFSDRLVSRLSAGLMVDLLAPGESGRRRIAIQLAKQHDLELAPEVLSWIAQNVVGTARDIHRFLLEANLNASNYSASNAENNEDSGQITETVCVAVQANIAVGKLADVKTIIRLVGKHFQLRASDITGASRKQAIVQARSIAIYLARQNTNLSLLQIGAAFGKRDHTTVMHALKKIETIYENDDQMKRTIDELQLEIMPT